MRQGFAWTTSVVLVTALAAVLVASPDPAPAAPAPIRLEGEIETAPPVEGASGLVVVPAPTFLIGSQDTTPAGGPEPDDTADPDDSPDDSPDASVDDDD